MKRILESPKIIVYENVEKIVKLLEPVLEDYLEYGGLSDIEIEALAKEILKTFNIPLGKKTEIELFQNDRQGILVTNKKGIAKMVVAPTK